ncbi:hypothetical protein [Kurthia sp. Dielmo]|uniref:hypothetical protein n=1 Tax=Kurthia sp. Dielmo TaxID=1033738 RepID=UPI0011243F45|nr:hypothetical protein [Kurthia sp. Dielmo]
MKAEKAIAHYLDGKLTVSSDTITIQGETLFSYATAIAQRTGDNEYIINITKYRGETVEAQTALRKQVEEMRANITFVSSVPIGESSLLPFAKMQKGVI